MRAAAWFLVLIACRTQQAPAPVPSSAPAPAPTPEPTTVAMPKAKSRLCGRAVSDPYAALAPDVTALIKKVTVKSPYKTFPEPPDLPVEVIAGVDAEIVDPKIRAAFGSGSIDALQKAGAKWCVAALLDSPDIDDRIHATRALAKIGGIEQAAYLLEVAQASAVFVPGSEEATLQGMHMQALVDTLNALTGEHVTTKPQQDPEGLKAGIPIWKRKICP
jgi:hypothetical protein